MTEKTLRAELENKGMHRSTYSSRVKRGWSKRRALSEPIREVGWRKHKGRAKPAAKGDGADAMRKNDAQPEPLQPDDMLALRIGRRVLASKKLHDHFVDWLLFHATD